MRMNGQQNLTEFWDDSISLEEPDFWDNVAKEPETISELLGKDFLYHATYKPYWEEIKKDGYIKPGKHTNWDNRYKTTRAIYLATDYDNAVYYAKNAENVPKELLNQIVVLKINANKLDVDQLDADSNQIYDSDGDEGRSIEDPYTWKEVEYYKPIPINAVVKVYDKSIIKESINKNMDEMLKESDLGESFYEDENKESLNEATIDITTRLNNILDKIDPSKLTQDDYEAAIYGEVANELRPAGYNNDIIQKVVDTYIAQKQERLQALSEVYPQKNETKTDFINRFMRVTAKEYPDVKQRYAVANSYWERRDKKRLKESENSIIEDLLNHFSLTEAYLDPEKRFWDYRTGQISGNDLFDTTRSESSYGQSFLDGLGKSDSKGRVGRIVEMSPTEYFKACAKGFGSSYAAQINQIKADKDTYQLLSDVIDKYNRQFPITYLDYSKGFAQEGRHRMYIAGERFGWNTKFPVLVIEAAESPLFELKENRDPSHKEKYVVTINKNRALIYGNNKRDLMYKLSLIEDNIPEEYFETIWKIIRNSNIG